MASPRQPVLYYGRSQVPGDQRVKEAVEIHFLLTRPLFGAGIPRRFLLRVSITKLHSDALPCGWLRKTKPQFESRRQLQPLETHRGAGAVRPSTTVLWIF